MARIELTEKELDYLVRVLEQNYADIYDDFDSERSWDFENPIKHQLYLKLSGQFYQYDLAEKIISAQKNSRITKLPRENSGYLGMGCGFRSIVHLNDLHKRLNYSGHVLSGQQQNGGQGTEFNEESDKQDQESLRNIIKDLMTAFGVLPEELIESKLEFDI